MPRTKEKTIPNLICPKCGRQLDSKEILQEKNRIGNTYLGCCSISDSGCGSVIGFEAVIKKR